ncbi:ribonuclease H [Malassezia psittaci]|uniref:ribonuclease H n=1 Tax=Malassezia psittaci TaxID=1821823 RepID=A0AAF0FCI3_9BASI|nr:ribonuclease H [Malassezia psittaci]
MECKSQVHQYPGSQYKAFPTRAEAQAFVQGKQLVEEAQHNLKRKAVILEDPSAAQSKSLRTSTAISSSPGGASQAIPNEQHDSLTVYTDGSSRGNGRVGAVAGYGVYWANPKYHHLNLAKRLSGPIQTNNRAELTAILRAIETCPEPDTPLRIFTDSQYAMNAVTKWIPNWQKNHWKTSTGANVQNQDLMMALYDAFTQRVPRPTIVYVRAHQDGGPSGKSRSITSSYI